MIVVIPARWSSTRFPGKPLADIAGKPMIQRVYENMANVHGCRLVCVATDDERIYECVRGFGGRAMMTSREHSCGTDRVEECVRSLTVTSDEVVVNVQGDEPLLPAVAVEMLVSVFDDHNVRMGSLMRPLADVECNDLNVVKVVTDSDSNALYFSRLPIPCSRDGGEAQRWAHVGVYAYRTEALTEFVNMPKGQVERLESLEQLRALEHGMGIRMVRTNYRGFGIDTPGQLSEAVKMIGVK